MSEEPTDEEIEHEAITSLVKSEQFLVCTSDGETVKLVKSVKPALLLIFIADILYRHQNLIEMALALVETRKEKDNQ